MIKKLCKLSCIGLILIIGIIFGTNYWIQLSTKNDLYTDANNVPPRHVGLVLGTSKKTVYGGVNQYFKHRMEAAAQLYENDKIKYVIVSGDNSIKEYNETRDMKEYLIKLGVPENRIVEDYAGFRTLDSVLRANFVFGQDSITIISQQFHNERALFIAKNKNINAIAFNAKDVSYGYSTKTEIREYFARVKAAIDLFILNKKPKFYEEKEIFPTDSIL